MALAKKFINDPNDIETEFIEGFMETYPGLRFLDSFPEVKVVFRGDVYPGPPYNKVAVISGGGSGHEPAHAGFVGEGMLTAAICGNLFASPTANAILAGIRTVTGPMGCLLIVENYTGDRLNFGLAAELAKCEGYKVEVVFVGDDCALPPPLGIAGRRGLAGTILVHKVAGAAAAAGLALADVAAEARYASENVGTVGIALNRCTLPGMVIERRLESGKIEVGPGINGESGRNVIDIQPVDMLVSHALKEILSKVCHNIVWKALGRSIQIIRVVETWLGGTPLGELMIPVGKTVPRLQMDHGLAIGRVYTGSFMTSLDMEGFSISIMRANPSILERLDAETKAPYWPVGVSGDRMAAKFPAQIPPCRSANIVEARSQPLQLTEQGQLFEAAIVAAANAIFNLKGILDEWDSKVGDGDCGSNMHRGAQAILEDVKNYPLNDAAKAVSEIGSSMGKAMGGTSGIIYSIFCEAACAQLKTNSHLGVMSTRWAEALAAAIAAVSKYGGARAGDRTLLDALIPASSLLEERLNHGDGPITAFVRSSAAALNGADSTKLMQAQAWGSAKVSQEILSTVPDPGAMAAASWYRAAAILLREREYYQA